MLAHEFESDIGADQGLGRPCNEDLSTVRRRTNACGAMNLNAHVPEVSVLDPASVQSHPDLDVRLGAGPRRPSQFLLRIHSRVKRVPSVLKVSKERVSLGAVYIATMSLDRPAQNPVMEVKHLRPLRPELARTPRRSLDVGEQHRHGAGRRLHMGTVTHERSSKHVRPSAEFELDSSLCLCLEAMPMLTRSARRAARPSRVDRSDQRGRATYSRRAG